MLEGRKKVLLIPLQAFWQKDSYFYRENFGPLPTTIVRVHIRTKKYCLGDKMYTAFKQN